MTALAAFRGLNRDDRVAIFIDGANLYQAARALGFDVDYKRLLETFTNECRLLRIYYYTALLDDQEYSPIRPLVDWLDYNGYTMVTKPLKEFTQSTGRRKFKGNMDVEIAVDMMDVADRIDHAILVSGDGDFRRLIDAVQRRGVRVSVVSTIKTQPPMIADELRRQADYFVDLTKLQGTIARAQAQRPNIYDPDETGEDDFDDDEFDEEFDDELNDDQDEDQGEDEDPAKRD